MSNPVKTTVGNDYFEGVIIVDPTTGDPTFTSGITESGDNFLPIKSLPANSWRCGFDKVIANNVDTDFLQLKVTGTGQTVNQTGGSLVLTAGTTASSETIVRSVESFKGNLSLRAVVTASQRIIRNNLYIELGDVVGDALAYTINSATSVTVTFPVGTNPFISQNVGQSMWLQNITGAAGIPERFAIASVSGDTVTFTVSGWPASGTGTLSLFGWNYHYILYESTSATSAGFNCQRNGWAAAVTPITINTTANGHVVTYTTSNGEVSVMDQTGASATAMEVTRRGSSVRNVPLPETELYLQVRSTNSSVGPASNTTYTIGFIDITNCSTMPVTIVDVSPMSANTGLPIEQVGSIPFISVTSPLVPAATQIKGGSGKIVTISLFNGAGTTRYVKFFNTLAANVIMGTTSAAFEIGIPTLGKAEFTIDGGFAFSAAMSWAVTSARGLTDNTATTVALGDVVGVIGYV